MNIDEARTRILHAIRCELEYATKPLNLKVRYRKHEGPVWMIGVEPASPTGARVLDEALEGSVAWWPGPPKGAADVLSVSAEQSQVNLRYATTEPPPVGGLLQIYPPRYLEALLDYWEQEPNAKLSLEWLESVETANSFDGASVPHPHDRLRPPLRDLQREAFKLVGWDAGFLWGPPGTGKTFTLGALVACYLLKFPERRVLVLSTTNSAVDLALISIDRTLEQLAASDEQAAKTRRRIFRIGNHFRASNYEDRKHLIPIVDKSLVERLVELEARKPPTEKVADYAQWKAQVEAVRAKIAEETKGIIGSAQLAAMTTTRAVFTIERIRELPPFELVVFDEASQVGLAHAIAVAPIGQATLFAGDPKQLAPIVQSEEADAREWLGESAFACQDAETACGCMLTEQSRMVEPICRLVSNIFYDGKLLVAKDATKDGMWSQVRRVGDVPGLGTDRACVIPMDKNGIWSANYHGPIRYDSAVRIKDLAGDLARHHDADDILVLTPFRAQRHLIRRMLKSNGLQRVQVSTVHKAQGSERHTVIFDPVQGDTRFLLGEEAKRLVNVALSRAMARLVVVLSPGDLKNPLLRAVRTVIEGAKRLGEAIPIDPLVKRSDFPACLLGKVVHIGACVGETFAVIDDGQKFVLADFVTGTDRTFSTAALKKRFS